MRDFGGLGRRLNQICVSFPPFVGFLFSFLFLCFSLSRENVTFKLFGVGGAFASRCWGMTDQQLLHHFSRCS